jgi:hypothetical protein
MSDSVAYGDPKYVHFDSLSLGGGVTIDTSASDNGFLACARTGWVNPPGDGTCQQAAQNLLGYGMALGSAKPGAQDISRLVIVGHGNAGLISTGDGQSPSTVLGYISSGNYAVWQPYFAPLYNHGSLLTLCGCDCGAEAAGALFLYQLATLINRPVRGRTGLVFLSCPGAYITYENGSVWQVAQPGVMPTPIPKPHTVAIPSDKIELASGVSELSELTRLTIHLPNGAAVRLDDQRGRSLAMAANLGQLVRIKGTPGAVTTGVVEVFVRTHKTESGHAFTIYNDRLLQDRSDPTAFYFCSAAFTQELNTLRLAAR